MLLLSAGCTAAAPQPDRNPGPNRHPNPSAEDDTKPDPISMAALSAKRYDGRNLKVGRRLGAFGSYTRSVVSYRCDGCRSPGS